MELELQSLFGLLCTAVPIVYRRHLFVSPWSVGIFIGKLRENTENFCVILIFIAQNLSKTENFYGLINCPVLFLYCFSKEEIEMKKIKKARVTTLVIWAWSVSNIKIHVGHT
jgi:hypothetical protein